MSAIAISVDAERHRDTDTRGDGWEVVEADLIEVRNVSASWAPPRWQYRVPSLRYPSVWFAVSPRYRTRDGAIKAARKVLA